MSVNLYVVPVVDGGGEVGRYPKYTDTTLAGLTVGAVYYGTEPTALLVAQNVPAGAHATMAGLADVVTVPDLAQTVGAQLATVQARLEALNIPAQWVTSGMSYGSVARYVAVLFLFTQVLTERLGRAKLFGGAVTLDTRFNQLPASVRQDLLDAAAVLNFDTSALSGASTIRQILKALADQWPALALRVGGAVL